jgi:hypothetical protein
MFEKEALKRLKIMPSNQLSPSYRTAIITCGTLAGIIVALGASYAFYR